MICNINETVTEQADSGRAAKIVSRVFSILTAVIMAAAVVFSAYVTLSAAHGRLVKVFGRSVLYIITGSMEPSVRVGDYVFIEEVPPGDLREGDIIAFYSEQADINGMLVLHRITKLNEDGTFVTKGDANTIEDSVNVRPERIAGRYTGKAHYFRWAGSFKDKRKIIMLFVLIPTAAAAAYEVRTVAQLSFRIAEEKKRAAAEERERQIREAIDREKERLAKEGYKPDK